MRLAGRQGRPFQSLASCVTLQAPRPSCAYRLLTNQLGLRDRAIAREAFSDECDLEAAQPQGVIVAQSFEFGCGCIEGL